MGKNNLAKVLALAALSKGGSGGGGLVINANSNTTIGSDVVPVLTAEQVTAAYNAVVAGQSCTIVDALGMLNLKVLQGIEAANEVSIFVLYFDRMILKYKDDETIEHKTLDYPNGDEVSY